MKVPVYRLRALDKELIDILQEADGRCSTAFALKLDDIRERIASSLAAVGASEMRIMRKHADKDGRGNPKPDEQGRLLFSTADQQDDLNAELTDLAKSELEVDESLANNVKKSELVANGLATSGTRITNLRPILDVSIPDEPSSRDASSGDRSIVISSPRSIPRA